jgi:hypothetical protein
MLLQSAEAELRGRVRACAEGRTRVEPDRDKARFVRRLAPARPNPQVSPDAERANAGIGEASLAHAFPQVTSAIIAQGRRPGSSGAPGKLDCPRRPAVIPFEPPGSPPICRMVVQLPALTGGFGTACAAIEALSRSLAGEPGPQGIRVVCLRSDAIPETWSDVVCGSWRRQH